MLIIFWSVLVNLCQKQLKQRKAVAKHRMQGCDILKKDRWIVLLTLLLLLLLLILLKQYLKLLTNEWNSYRFQLHMTASRNVATLQSSVSKQKRKRWLHPVPLSGRQLIIVDCVFFALASVCYNILCKNKNKRFSLSLGSILQRKIEVNYVSLWFSQLLMYKCVSCIMIHMSTQAHRW